MKPLPILLLLGLSLLLFDCTRQNYLLGVEASDSFREENHTIKKVVIIDPDYVWLEKKSSAEDLILQREDREATLHKILKKNARRAGLELEIVSPISLDKSQVSYFNDLLPLKEQILQSNFLQESYSYAEDRPFGKTFFNNTFQNPPILDSEHSWLAKEYGTPYFLFQGMIASKKFRIVQSNWRNIYFNILVNVESGQIAYREVRTFRTPPTRNHLNGLFYDSFNIIRKLK